MRTMWRGIAGIAVAVVTGVVATLAQTPAPVTVVGQVVSATTGAPVAGAAVSLNGATRGGPERNAVAGDDGRFVFDNVPAGKYYMFATKPGFFTAGLNDDTQHGASDVLVIGWPGPPLITLKLRPQGAITGTVFDDANKPVAGAKVTVLSRRQVWPSWGKRLAWDPMMAPETVVTDQRGSYVIDAVDAGEYILRVDAGQLEIPGPPPRTLGTTYAPGPGDLPSAMPFRLALGERRVADVQLNAKPAFDLAGVTEIPGDTGSACVQLLSIDDAAAQHRRPVSDWANDWACGDAGGQFRYLRLPPGEYVLVARINDRFWAEQNVTIDHRSLTDVRLALKPMIVVSGRVIWEGVDRPPDRSTWVRKITSNVEGRSVGDPGPTQFVTQYAVGLANLLPVGLSRPTSQVVHSYTVEWASDNTFSLTVPRERYLVSTYARWDGWFVKSFRINGREATDEPVDIESNTNDAVLTMTRAAGEVRGTVVTPAGRPDSGGQVVLFPTNRRLWPTQYASYSLHVFIEIIDETGRFTVPNVRPGEYYLAATQNVDIDPEMLQRLAGSAVRIQVPAGVPIVRTLTRAR